MPGKGPAPRLNRSRRGKPAHGDWVQLDELKDFVLPELDEIPCPLEDGWPYTAKKYWESWRNSPVTSRWAEDDIAFAIDTITQFATTQALKKGQGGVPLAASEMRLRMESLGLTPEGRRKSRLLLPEEDPDDLEKPKAEKPERNLPEAV